MIVYSLIFVVFIKYIIIVLCADRDREGGVLVLASLIPPDPFKPKRKIKKTAREEEDDEEKKQEVRNLPSPPYNFFFSSLTNNFFCVLKEQEQAVAPPSKWETYLRGFCVFLSFCGVGLLLGDGAITPAISVLSAIEGVITQYSNFSSAEVRTLNLILFPPVNSSSCLTCQIR